jgi:DNA repair protein RadD
MTLRPYQQEAHDAVIEHIKQSTLPCLVEAATGAGKSLIIAELAKTIHRISKGLSILVLCPNKEILEQNREKYLATGSPASIFSAALGAKCLRHPVVFGTPQSVKNSVGKFGDRFAMVIIDEAHGITPSVISIIEHLQQKRSKLRIVGLTATPYRMTKGFIYEVDSSGKNLTEEEAYNPFFYKLVYSIKARYLIEQGFLTDPIIGQLGAGNYDTSNLKLNSIGKFEQKEVDRAFIGKGRLTANIVADIIAQSRDRRGVMIFASTIQHAKEIMESLPPELSAIVTGETHKKERETILKNMKAQRIKYIVNVAVLTVGTDIPHVDVVALMRATESVGLLQQIIGRGLRLFTNKDDCLILDYAENIHRHCPDGDIFNPIIRANIKSTESVIIEVDCPDGCGMINRFSARKNTEGYKINNDGYFTDLMGEVIQTSSGQGLAAHYGRRCNGYIFIKGILEPERCGYRWSFKVCEKCNEENDIAARYCRSCKGELIDPNEKLVLEFQELKKDPTKIQIDEVLDIQSYPTISQAGNECLRVEFVTPFRKFAIWLQVQSKNERSIRDYQMFRHFEKGINTVEYKKESNGFYKVISYNKEIQKCKIQNTPTK